MASPSVPVLPVGASPMFSIPSLPVLRTNKPPSFSRLRAQNSTVMFSVFSAE